MRPSPRPEEGDDGVVADVLTRSNHPENFAAKFSAGPFV
jgi:hypothetical protein